MCPVSIRLGWGNVLPRQLVNASDPWCHESATCDCRMVILPSVVVDREEYRHNDTHQWHEYDKHRPDQSNKEVSIQPAFHLELFVFNTENPADPFDWVRRYGLDP